MIISWGPSGPLRLIGLTSLSWKEWELIDPVGFSHHLQNGTTSFLG